MMSITDITVLWGEIVWHKTYSKKILQHWERSGLEEEHKKNFRIEGYKFTQSCSGMRESVYWNIILSGNDQKKYLCSLWFQSRNIKYHQ